MYYSQFGEDRILAEFFRGKRAGTCVEVGANDGITGSNSYYFEKVGWTCVLVEPNLDLCVQIRANRSALLFACAASDSEGTAVLQVAEGAEFAHAISTLEAGGDAARRINAAGFTARPVDVPLRRLDDILVEAGIKAPVDFVTIDVEGHEMSVLAGFSIPRWTPTVLIIEDNSGFTDRRISSHLEQFGYVPFLRTGVNDWYAHKDNREFVRRSRQLAYALTGVATRGRNGSLRAARAILDTIPGARNLYRSLRRRP